MRDERRLTVREVLEKLSELPEHVLDKEFVVFSTNTGFRTVFPTDAARIALTMSLNGSRIEVQGTQDPNQLMR